MSTSESINPAWIFALVMFTLVANISADEPSPGDVKSVTSAKTAIKGGVSDAIGETYGVVGVSNSPDGAGLGAANTNGGADLVLDGSADGQPDAILTQAGIDRPSGSNQSFTLHNSGAGGLDLVVEGMLFGSGAGLTSVDAASLGGLIPEEFALNVELAASGLSSVHWGNLTSIPAGLADGDDDALGALGCSEAQIAKWNGSGWVCSHDVGAAYSRTHVVGPVGTASENGTELLAALASIPAPASQAEARLLKIEPGVYDVGTMSFAMKSWVDVEGSGEEVTLIVGSVCESSASAPTAGLVIGAGRAQLRLLTVQNTCADSNLQSVALFNDENALRCDHITIRASGAAKSNYGVFNNGDDVELTHLTVVASGANDFNFGMNNETGTRLRASHSSFAASTGLYSYGILNKAIQLMLNDVVATATDSTNVNTAVYLGTADSSSLTNLIAKGSGGSNQWGIEAFNSSFRMEGGIAEGGHGVDLNTNAGDRMVVLDHVTVNGTWYGLETFDTSGNLVVMVNNSSIRGVIYSISNMATDVFVGGTQLAGGAVTGSGVTTCAGVWDESYTFYPNSCP